MLRFRRHKDWKELVVSVPIALVATTAIVGLAILFLPEAVTGWLMQRQGNAGPKLRPRRARRD
jgi:hypothetical protein